MIGDWMGCRAYADELRRGVTYTWQDLLEEVVDRDENPDEFTGGRPIADITVEEFKEILIEQNFGHFIHDW